MFSKNYFSLLWLFLQKKVAAWIIQKHLNIQKEVKIGWIQLSFIILKIFSQKKLLELSQNPNPKQNNIAQNQIIAIIITK